MAIYIRECITCGTAFKGGPRAWYCPDCREERKKAQKREQNLRQKNHLTRPIGSTDTCKNCGKQYTVSNGKQMYCEECGPMIVKKNQAEQKLKEYHENKDIINPVRNERRRCPPRRCAVCGKDFAARGMKKYCSKECAEVIHKALQPAYDARRKNK